MAGNNIPTLYELACWAYVPTYHYRAPQPSPELTTYLRIMRQRSATLIIECEFIHDMYDEIYFLHDPPTRENFRARVLYFDSHFEAGNTVLFINKQGQWRQFDQQLSLLSGYWRRPSAQHIHDMHQLFVARVPARLKLEQTWVHASVLPVRQWSRRFINFHVARITMRQWRDPAEDLHNVRFYPAWTIYTADEDPRRRQLYYARRRQMRCVLLFQYYWRKYGKRAFRKRRRKRRKAARIIQNYWWQFQDRLWAAEYIQETWRKRRKIT